jgi:hypothetical protein
VGFGKSAKPEIGYSFDLMTANTVQLLDQLAGEAGTRSAPRGTAFFRFVSNGKSYLVFLLIQASDLYRTSWQIRQ